MCCAVFGSKTELVIEKYIICLWKICKAFTDKSFENLIEDRKKRDRAIAR